MTRIYINGEYITHFRFADNIVVLAETMEDLSTTLNDLSEAYEELVLRMNMDKTKIILNDHIVPTPITFGRFTLWKSSRVMATYREVQRGQTSHKVD
jgi:hypothetical protein